MSSGAHRGLGLWSLSSQPPRASAAAVHPQLPSGGQQGLVPRPCCLLCPYEACLQGFLSCGEAKRLQNKKSTNQQSSQIRHDVKCCRHLLVGCQSKIHRCRGAGPVAREVQSSCSERFFCSDSAMLMGCNCTAVKPVWFIFIVCFC